MNFRALRAFDENGKTVTRITSLQESDLTPGNVLIEVHYSSVNYKDALAGTGRGRILKKLPLNPGIDAAGVIVKSEDPSLAPGQEVIVTGCNTGEVYDGGFSELLRTHASSVIPKPRGLSLRESMILGTAGFTAALALLRMERNGQTPEMGPIVITGASGGVGSLAVQLFSQKGYRVLAVSGKQSFKETLQELGAEQVVSPSELNLGKGPLESVRFGGAVDNVGGATLSGLLAATQIYGNIACIGLAESAELKATVMPLILRGVSLIGVSSNNTPRPVRDEIWKNLSGPWKLLALEKVLARTISLEELPQAFHDLLDRKVQGRILVETRRKKS